MQSIGLETNDLSAADLFPLSMAMALGAYDWFREKAGEEACIKWPNDLYWRDRKAGGILIENLWTAGHWQFAIVGMGINLNQRSFDPAVKNPLSLLQITGRTYDRLQEAAIAQRARIDRDKAQRLRHFTHLRRSGRFITGHEHLQLAAFACLRRHQAGKDRVEGLDDVCARGGSLRLFGGRGGQADPGRKLGAE